MRTDNGCEYLSNKFRAYLSENGIHHQLTVAYTPQQKSVAERMNRTLMNLVRSMLHHKSIEKKVWAEALATAVYVRNRVTSRVSTEALLIIYGWDLLQIWNTYVCLDHDAGTYFPVTK